MRILPKRRGGVRERPIRQQHQGQECAGRGVLGAGTGGVALAICGSVMTILGLPAAPAAEAILLREDRETEGRL
jgi:hypothetical protein